MRCFTVEVQPDPDGIRVREYIRGTFEVDAVGGQHRVVSGLPIEGGQWGNQLSFTSGDVFDGRFLAVDQAEDNLEPSRSALVRVPVGYLRGRFAQVVEGTDDLYRVETGEVVAWYPSADADGDAEFSAIEPILFRIGQDGQVAGGTLAERVKFGHF